MSLFERMEDVPEGSIARRVGYALLLTLGIVLTAAPSYLFNLIPPVSFRFIPDLRYFGLLVMGLGMGFNAAFGASRKRTFALLGVLGVIVVFHLEEATVHWIGPIPGSITGTRVGLIGTAGSLLAVAAIVLMHVEVESGHLRRDLKRRGAAPDEAEAVAVALARVGKRQVWGIASAMAALGLLIFALEKAFGDTASGGVYVLFVGGGLMLALALYLLRLMPQAKPREAEPEPPAEAP